VQIDVRQWMSLLVEIPCSALNIVTGSSRSSGPDHFQLSQQINYMRDYHLRDNSLSEADFKRGDGARLGSVEPLSSFRAHPFLDLPTTDIQFYRSVKIADAFIKAISVICRHAPFAS
jgi:hypothetical protein